MDNNKISIRSITLFILGILIILGGVISVSYSYHTSGKTLRNTTYNINMGCLNIVTNTSSYPVIQVTPSSLYPISDTQATTTNGDYPSTSPGYGNSGQAFGQIGFKIHNNCATAVKVDIMFVPSSSNQIGLENIKYARCLVTATDWTSSGGCFVPNGSSSVYGDVYVLGTDANTTCFTTSSTPTALFQYLASSSIGGYPLGGVDQRMCSVVRSEYSTGLSIAANATYNYALRWWLAPEEPVDPSVYVNKGFAGKFVVYTMP